MSQFDFGDLESPLTGEEFINGNLEPWRDALHSCHIGDERPSYAVAGTLWIDNSETPWALNVFQGSDDIVMGTLDPSTLVFTPPALVDGSVTNAKLADIATSRIKGRATASTGVVEDLTGAQVRAIAEAQEELSGLSISTATVEGTDKVLVQDDSDSDNLKTVTAQEIADLGSGGGEWEPVQTDTLSGTTYDITSLFVDGYDYKLVPHSVSCTQSRTPRLRYRNSVGVVSSGDYAYLVETKYNNSGSLGSSGSAGITTQVDLTARPVRGTGGTTEAELGGEIILFNPANASSDGNFQFDLSGYDNSNANIAARSLGSGHCRTTEAFTGVRLYWDGAGDFAGKISIYRRPITIA